MRTSTVLYLFFCSRARALVCVCIVRQIKKWLFTMSSGNFFRLDWRFDLGILCNLTRPSSQASMNHHRNDFEHRVNSFCMLPIRFRRLYHFFCIWMRSEWIEWRWHTEHSNKSRSTNSWNILKIEWPDNLVSRRFFRKNPEKAHNHKIIQCMALIWFLWTLDGPIQWKISWKFNR